MMVVSSFAPQWNVLLAWMPPFVLFAFAIRNIVSVEILAVVQVGLLVWTTYETATSRDSFIYIIHWVYLPPLFLIVVLIEWSMRLSDRDAEREHGVECGGQ